MSKPTYVIVITFRYFSFLPWPRRKYIAVSPPGTTWEKAYDLALCASDCGAHNVSVYAENEAFDL